MYHFWRVLSEGADAGFLVSSLLQIFFKFDFHTIGQMLD